MEYIRTIISFLFFMSLFLCGTSYAFNNPYVEWDSTQVNVNGAMVFTPGSFIQWGDGSVISTMSALTCTGTAGPPGPAGPRGETGPAGPPGSAFLNATLATIVSSKRLTIADASGLWHTQGATWAAFSPSFEYHFLKNLNNSPLRLFWSDTVGIYNNNWCNVGLFLDDSSTPVCVSAWSGVKSTTVFSTQHMHCIVDDLPAGEHVLKVKHRSQYCNYGNFSFDQHGLNRIIQVEEDLNAH